MKHSILTSLATALLALPLTTQAQTEVDLEPELGGRLSVAIDKRITRGLHISFEEEARLDKNLTGFDRLQHTLAASYKVHPNIKLGLGYSLINPYSSSSAAFKGMRHRVMLDAMWSYHTSLWTFAIKERLQMTARSGDYNVYQSPATAWALKSRVSAKYKGWQQRGITPYAYVELRQTFSGPSVTATYIGDAYRTQYSQSASLADTVGDPGWFLDGFNSVYLNRIRTCIGVDYRMTRASTLTFYLLADRIRDKVIDANKLGTKLFTYTDERGFMATLGAMYTYSF